MVAGQNPTIEIVTVPGHPYSKGSLKAVGYLSKPGEKFVNAASEFSTLAPKVQKGLNTALTFWLQGMPRPKRHHGWDVGEHDGRHVNCYVFKHTDGSRIYGFLSHPTANKRAQICCLVHFTQKNQEKTELTILNQIETLRVEREVVAAVESYWNLLTAQ